MTAPTPFLHYDCKMTRRSIFLGGGASLLFAPAIVRATSLMPVRSLMLPIERPWAGFCERLFYHMLECDLRAGRMGTNLNGRIISVVDARRLVAHARAQGWLQTPSPAISAPTKTCSSCELQS
jgi:hypothetical protein